MLQRSNPLLRNYRVADSCYSVHATEVSSNGIFLLIDVELHHEIRQQIGACELISQLTHAENYQS